MKKNIPNIITCCNLISGCIATMFAFMGRPDMALLFIIIGAGFDFCDGLAARALGVSSPIGKEMDSLADDITFGFAPSAIVFHQLSVMDMPASIGCVAEYVPFLAFIIAAYSALRLAKFNLDTRQSTSFIGLPTPANALFWGSLIVGYSSAFENLDYGFAYILVLVLLSSYLLVAELPMFAFKFKHWGINEPGNMVKYGFMAFSVMMMAISALLAESALTGFISSLTIIILAYILVSVIMCVKK